MGFLGGFFIANPGHRQEERELAANTKALQDRTERRDTTLKRLNRLQVGPVASFRMCVFIVLLSSVADP